MTNEIVEVSKNTEVEIDLEEARQTYKDLIDKGKLGLESAFELLEASQHPRAVETFSGLLSTLAQVNEKLVNLQDVKVKSRKNSDNISDGASISNTQNNIYVGSTADILRLMSANTDDDEEGQI